MSAFGSSAINKSSKKIAPKIPAQRRRQAGIAGAPASEHSSARASTERRDVSQNTSSGTAALAAHDPPASPPAYGDGGRLAVGVPHGHLSPPSQATTVREATIESRSHGAPILIISEESVSTQNSSHVDPLLRASSIPSVMHEHETTTGSSHSIAVSSSAAGGQGDLESTSTAKRKASSEVETANEDPKRRKSSHLQHVEASPSTAIIPRDISPAIIPTIELDGGTEVSSIVQSSIRSAPPGKAATAKGKRRTVTNPGRLSTEVEEAERDQVLKQKRKTRSKAKTRSADAAQPAEAAEGPSSSRSQDPSKARRGRRAREKTPDDAENIEIASSVVKMSDLCKDTRTGRKSERSKEIEKMESMQASRKQRERRTLRENAESPAAEAPDQRLEKSATERAIAEQNRVSAPRMRLVNGKLILDESSLQVDRHANAAAAAEPMEQVEESQYTRPVNAGTWGKKEKTEPWAEESTDRFYNALRMFGTDFGMVSKMFPGRSRRQIKLKFNREERINPQRITETLIGPRLPVDMAEISELTMTEYQDPEAFARELEEEAAAHAAEQKRLQDTIQENIRQSQATTTEASGDGTGGNSSAKENQPQGSDVTSGASLAAKRGKKPTDKRKKIVNSRYGGGGEVEVIGTI